MLRIDEQPFIVYNVPDVEETVLRWTHEYLLEKFDSYGERLIEKSKDNHFMYYKGKKRRVPNWTPPQEQLKMTYEEFINIALTMEREEGSKVAGNSSLYYMNINAGEGRRTEWIAGALKIFEKKTSFFVIEPKENKGINCRFGMRGVVAAAHYDGGRNFIAMIKGHKRYILQPPSQCKYLEMLQYGHPSARHSPFDWSNMTEVNSRPEFKSSKATEVVLAPGDVLYVPAFWMHFIVSLDVSVQCNTRSGMTKEHGYDDIKLCMRKKKVQQ